MARKNKDEYQAWQVEFTKLQEADEGWQEANAILSNFENPEEACYDAGLTPEEALETMRPFTKEVAYGIQKKLNRLIEAIHGKPK